MRTPTGLISRFLTNHRGNVAMLFAMSAIPVFGITALAVDYSRAMSVRAKIQAAADAAAITAMRIEDQSDDARLEAAQKAFAANIESLNDPMLSIEPSFSMAYRRVRVTVKATVRTTVSSVIGVSDINVNADSSASRVSSQQNEVALMIDLTGSMGETRSGRTKVDGLRTAGADLLNILLPYGSSTTDTRVSIVPFADYVNAGDYAAAVTGLPSTASYTPATDLAGTKNGNFTGSYSGYTGNTFGSESGVTPQDIAYPGQTSPAGTVYKNGYCGASQTSSAGTIKKINGAPVGLLVPAFVYSYGINAGRVDAYTGSAPNGLTSAGQQPAYLLVPYDYVGDLTKYQPYINGNWQYVSAHTSTSARNWPDHYMSSDRRLAAYYRTTSLTLSSTPSTVWSSDYYYAPIFTNPGDVKPLIRTATDTWPFTSTAGQTKTGPVGYDVTSWSTYTTFERVGTINPQSPVPSEAIKVETNGYGGYWARVDYYFKPDGIPQDNYSYEWRTSGYYIPADGDAANNGSSSSSTADCSNTPTTGKLISCVTERTGSNDYSDAAPSSGPVGPYNHGDGSTVSNYSSDGKCWTAGRELPKVIPLTNDKTTLSDFFKNAEFGGGTAGHIGAAWSWYTLSPSWSSIWPSASKPGDYDNKAVTKTAVIVTDGEFNMEYSSDASRTQALAICQAMKSKGITIYTVGYGLSTSAAPGDNWADGKAKELLAQCATSDKHAFFPYDGAELGRTVAQIGQAIKSQSGSTTVGVQ